MGSYTPEPSAPKESASAPFVLPDYPQGYARPLRVISVGGGASGLSTAYHIQKYLKNVDLTIYEKNSAIGGTWFENIYPGIGCDVPAHNYEFQWALNPNYKHFYPSGAECLEYFQSTAKKFDLEKYIQLNSRVTGAVWHEDESIWKVTIQNEANGTVFEDWAHFFINGCGFLNHWKWPNIEGIKDFKGDMVHSANWDPNLKLKGKNVALVGNGSSAIQILVNIYPEVEHLTNLIRNPTWVTTSYAQDYAGPNGTNFEYTEEAQKEFAEDPQKFLAYRKGLEEAMTSRFDLALKDSPVQAMAQKFLAQIMLEKIGDHPLKDILIPSFGVGCRRPTPGIGYLETLVKDNVRVVTDHIQRIVPDGIELVTGEVIKVDSIILATGFDYSWVPRFPLIGRNGCSIQEQWKDRSTGYLTIAVNNFPNYLVYMGPNSPISHGSTLPAIEAASKYMIRMIWKAQTQGYKSFVPTDAAVADFIEYNDTFHKKTVWGSNCKSWFNRGKEGSWVNTYPGSRVANIQVLQTPRFEDYEWRPISSNRFAYLGNGQSSWEEEGKDRTWYIDAPDAGLEEIRY